jgi:hypothetical protein
MKFSLIRLRAVSVSFNCQGARSPDLRGLLRKLLNEEGCAKEVSVDDDPDYSFTVKTRTIDPDVLVDGGFKKLSEIDAKYRGKLSAYVGSKKGRMYHVKFWG